MLKTFPQDYKYKLPGLDEDRKGSLHLPKRGENNSVVKNALSRDSFKFIKEVD